MRRLAIATCLVLFVQTSPSAAHIAKDVQVRGQIVSVKPEAGCGIFWFGSPVTYQIISGDQGWVGKQVTVLVACIELPRPESGIRHFAVGDIQDLVLSRSNVEKIEVPSSPPAQWLYLRSASVAKT